MPHWIMLEMAKLSKEKRERIERLLSQNKCICCEKKPPRARGRCQTCLDLIYLPKRFGNMVEAIKLENKAVREGTMLGLYDKVFKHIRKLVRANGGRPVQDALKDANGPAA